MQSASSVSINNSMSSLDQIRRSAKFHPSIWGDYFLAYNSDNTEISVVEQEELARQKEMVKKLLIEIPDDSTYKMELIDAIQRMGVHYHFKNEIDEYLQYIHSNDNKENDIRIVALRFRLLRQNGYNVSCDVFRKFIDCEGNFVESLKNNVEGVLNLYEAAHLGTDGDDILHNAIEFCSSLLHQMNKAFFSRHVDEALKMPIRKTLTRLGAKTFISMYQERDSHNEMLLNFAKLDFNILQKMHQRELSEATRWWKKLDVANKMPYARDRLVETFFWSVGVYFEPHQITARRVLTKIINMASILDDTYEYATLYELQILTDAIQSWDANEIMEGSPPHIQLCYKILVDTYIDIENEMENQGKSYRVQYAKEEMKKLVRAYFEEVKWMYNNYVPTVEEYTMVTLVSCGYMMASTSSLVGMGDLVTKEDFDWISSEPPMVRASSVIYRFMDDLVGDAYEKKTSAVDCYMKQYSFSKDEACAELRQLVNKAWMDMNQECIEPRAASIAILMRVFNFGRVINLLYAEDDSYANPIKAKDWVKMVFVEPVTI